MNTANADGGKSDSHQSVCQIFPRSATNLTVFREELLLQPVMFTLSLSSVLLTVLDLLASLKCEISLQ